MVNNSDKVYKFTWDEVEHIVIKPTMGYISPGEEKDLEIMFFARQPICIKKVKMETIVSVSFHKSRRSY